MQPLGYKGDTCMENSSLHFLNLSFALLFDANSIFFFSLFLFTLTKSSLSFYRSSIFNFYLRKSLFFPTLLTHFSHSTHLLYLIRIFSYTLLYSLLYPSLFSLLTFSFYLIRKVFFSCSLSSLSFLLFASSLSHPLILLPFFLFSSFLLLFPCSLSHL